MLFGRPYELFYVWENNPLSISSYANIFSQSVGCFFVLSMVSFPGGSEGEESACNIGDSGSIPGSGRSPEEGNGNPLQYSCLENPMDGGAWSATVHGVAKSQTRLSDFTS